MGKQKYTKEGLLYIIRARAKRLGRPPYSTELPQASSIIGYFGSWAKALEAAGLEAKTQRKYTKEELLDIIKAKAEELGRVPNSSEILQGSTITRRFGSWDKALEEVGMKPNKRKKYTKEELLDIIKTKVEELGRPPYSTELPQASSIIGYFGSWAKALEAAGLEAKTQRKYTKEELLDIIKAKAEKLGRAPYASEVAQGAIIARIFGGWDKALGIAGMKVNYIRELKYTKEELLNIIKAKTEELGRTPNSIEIPQASSIIRYFGSWNKALEAAGMKPNTRKYTKEELLDIIRAKAEELGRVPYTREVSKATTIARVFGGWDKAIEAAEITSKSKLQKAKNLND